MPLADHTLKPWAKINLSFKIRFILLYVFEWFSYMDICVPRACLVYTEVRRGWQRPRNWSYCGPELPCRCWESNPGSLSFFALLFGGVFTAEQSNSPYTFRLPPVVLKYFELVFLSLASSRELFPFYSQTKHLLSTEFFHNIPPTQPILRSYTLCYLRNSLSALQYQASSGQRPGLACPGCSLFDSMSRLDFWMEMWWTQGSQTVQVATEIVSKLENLSYKSVSSVDGDSKQIQWMLLEYHILIVSIL